MIQKIFKKIEDKRGSQNLFFRTAVTVKDIAWYILYALPVRIAKINKNYFSTIITYPFLKTVFMVEKMKKNKYQKVSFCITCMGRLVHIQKTLEKNILNNIKYPNLEFVLLDYNSPDGLKEWVFTHLKKYIDSGVLVYYRTERPTYFHVTRAKNMVHRLATGDILCNLDADNFTGKDFAFYLNYVFTKHPHSIVSCKDLYGGGYIGRIALEKDDFFKIGGYDEEFFGYGYEDYDIRLRAGWAGYTARYIPFFFLKYIEHDTKLREKHTPLSLEESWHRNAELLFNRSAEIVQVKNQEFDPSEVARIRS